MRGIIVCLILAITTPFLHAQQLSTYSLEKENVKSFSNFVNATHELKKNAGYQSYE